MKKVLILILAYVLLTSVSSAQYYAGPVGTGNPGNINQEDFEYPYGGGLPAGWNVVHSGNSTNAQWSNTFPLPFTFQFNGSNVTSFKVSTSGVLTFTTGASSVPSSINSTLPSNNIPAASICVWGLSGKGTNDYIMQKTFGTTPNRQHWISFTAYSLPAIVNNHYTFWSIVLEEGTNAIYVVDQRTSNNTSMALTVGVQVDNNFGLTAAGSPNINSLAGDDPSRANNIYYSFLPGNQPSLDLKGDEVLLDDYIAAPNGPFNIKMVVQNLGSDTITQVDMNYVNSGSLKTTATITNLNILPWGYDTLTHPQPWSATAGTTVFKAWAENLNGSVDENTTNDTAFKSLTILANSVNRVPLLETFTSSTSVPSKNFNSQFENTVSQFGSSVVHVKYPMSWPGSGDPYYTNEGGARRQYYGVSTLPYLHVDGTDWNDFNTLFTPNVLSAAQNKMALIDLDAKFYYSGKTVCTEITIDPLVNITNTNLTLYAAIYEKATFNNTKSNGETVFYNVMKKMLPNANGTALQNLNAGNPQTENFCFTFNGNYVLPPNANSPVNLTTNHTIEEFSDLGVAVWIQDDQTKEVYQASEAANSIGLQEALTENEISVFPNPADDLFHISIESDREKSAEVHLTSITGQVVFETSLSIHSGKNILSVDAAAFPQGVYFVTVTINQEQVAKKIILH